MANLYDRTVGNPDPLLNDTPGIGIPVADAAARAALPAIWAASPFPLLDSQVVHQLDTDSYYAWNLASLTWTLIGTASAISGSGTAGHLAGWAGADSITQSGVLFNEIPAAYPLNYSGIKIPSGYALTCDTGTETLNLASFFPGPNWLMFGNPYQPNNSTVIYGRMEDASPGSPNDPTLMSGGIIGTGYQDFDCDGGVYFRPIPLSYGSS